MTHEAVTAAICANVAQGQHDVVLTVADKEVGGNGSGTNITPINFLQKNIPINVFW
jgi:hypothetical protein